MGIWHYRGFRLQTCKNAATSLAVGLAYIASVWMGVSLHNDVIAVTLILLSFWVPNIILSPVSGVYVDRFDRRHILALANTLRAFFLILFGFLLSLHRDTLLLLCLINASGGACFALAMPANTRIMREIVPPELLLNANGIADMLFEAGFMIGMSITGFVIALTSYVTVFCIAGGLFLIGVIFTCMVRPKDFVNISKKADLPPEKLYHEYWHSVKYIWQKPLLKWMTIVQIFLLITFMTLPVVTVPFAKNILHADATQYGVLEAFISIGVIIGSGLMAFWQRLLGETRLFLTLFGAGIVAFIAFMLNNLLYRADMIGLLLGFGISVWTLAMTRCQHLTDLSLQGRVQATFSSIAGVGMLLVYWLLASLSKDIRLVHLLWVEVALIACAVLAFCRYEWLRIHATKEQRAEA